MDNRCGTCTWTKPVVQDLNFVVCYGAPPVPVLMPMQTPNGQTAVGIQLLRPNIPRTECACSRYMPKALPDASVPDAEANTEQLLHGEDGHGV